ncbi:UNVERIFIED_CONTAM: hypothetical protein RMT77_009196 [Armadillidium vulgare]|nr:Translocation protein SEC63-like protein [Armadillidium vulgare]
MAGQKFQYDESGSTFLYFLISFLGLVLVPCTFIFWPAETTPQDETKKKQICHCEGCIKKVARMKKPEKWKGLKKTFQRFILALGWLFLAFLVYKVQEFDYEYANFDPYEIIGVGLQASQAEIRKAYKKQSVILHPDKPTGDHQKFMRLQKAYEALTDETARRNYELYGNPDGPGAMHFGIALPSWIVEKENSLWVLGLYALVFMIGLPTAVAIWWYRSSKFSNDQVLLDTTQLYYYFIHKTPQMVFKRALMVLAASLEFEKGHNPEIVERPSDNIEIPSLIKQIPNLGEKNKERPLCFPYSIKARALLFAHLSRIPLKEETLDQDRLYIVKLCPTLINEMVNCVSQLIMLAYAGRIPRIPSLDTIEATMKLSPHVVQALIEGKSSLLQLPHVTDDIIRHFVSKKKQIKTIHQLVALPSEERRQMLRTLTEDQYNDVMRVCEKLPHLEMSVNYEVVDDDDSGVFTAGAIVTVTVNLHRSSLEELFHEKHVDLTKTSEEMKEKRESQIIKSSGWRRPQSSWKGKASKKNKPNHVIKNKKDKVHDKDADKEKEAKKLANGREKKMRLKKTKLERVEDIENDSEDDDSASHSDESEAGEADTESHRDEKNGIDEDAEWEKFQRGLTKREKVLEGKSKLSHCVHSPYFTDDKQEYWWAYVCDRKKRSLITAPFQITNLVTNEEVQLKFTAPMKPGIYTFQVCVRSDSYLGFDICEDIKLDVKEAREIPTAHPQWEEFSSDEDEDEDDDAGVGNDDDESEYTTDDEVTDDSD